MNISRHYLGDCGREYFSQAFGEGKNLGRLLQSDFFLPFCREDLIILDFGCADGLFLRNLPAKRRIGVEAISEARTRCLEICQEEGCTIDLYQSLEDVGDDIVDVIISNHCLEHVPNPLAALHEMLRILKDKGRLVLMLPFDDWRIKEYREWLPCDRDNHLYTWSPMNIGNLLTEVGFVVDSAKLVTSAWSPKFMGLHRFLPAPVFSGICRAFASIRNRRQVFCLAHKP